MNLLFFDVDGTLLEFSKGIRDISPELKAALAKIHANGDKYFICTGRSHGGLPSSILEMGADGYSLCAGAFVTVNAELVRNAHFSQATLDFILQRLGQFETLQYLECGLRLYTNHYGTPASKLFNEKFGIRETNLEPLAQIRGLEVNKISVTFKNMADIDCMEDFADHGITVLVQPSPDSFDITLAGSTKRDGIKAVKEYLGYPKNSKVYAFGDNYNDIEMIEYADVGVAMGNGPQDLKYKADYITKNVEDDGVLFALKELGLI